MILTQTQVLALYGTMLSAAAIMIVLGASALYSAIRG
jgi:hypothetical protein